LSNVQKLGSGVAVAMEGKRFVLPNPPSGKDDVKLCPFDGLPCEKVDCCDNAMILVYGILSDEAHYCSRAVFRAGRK
jgi:hypothetical protein